MNRDTKDYVIITGLVWVVLVLILIQVGRTPDPEEIITPPPHTIEEVTIDEQ